MSYPNYLEEARGARESWRQFLAPRDPDATPAFDYGRPGYRLALLDEGGPLVLVVLVKTFDTYTACAQREELVVRHPHALPDMYHDDEWAADFVRRILHRVDNHETDEWIRVRGVMVFDPHKGDLT